MLIRPNKFISSLDLITDTPPHVQAALLSTCSSPGPLLFAAPWFVCASAIPSYCLHLSWSVVPSSRLPASTQVPSGYNVTTHKFPDYYHKESHYLTKPWGDDRSAFTKLYSVKVRQTAVYSASETSCRTLDDHILNPRIVPSARRQASWRQLRIILPAGQTSRILLSPRYLAHTCPPLQRSTKTFARYAARELEIQRAVHRRVSGTRFEDVELVQPPDRSTCLLVWSMFTRICTLPSTCTGCRLLTCRRSHTILVALRSPRKPPESMGQARSRTTQSA